MHDNQIRPGWTHVPLHWCYLFSIVIPDLNRREESFNNVRMMLSVVVNLNAIPVHDKYISKLFRWHSLDCGSHIHCVVLACQNVVQSYSIVLKGLCTCMASLDIHFKKMSRGLIRLTDPLQEGES